MRSLRKNPHLYEINLITWLHELCQREQEQITLKNIPEGIWADIKQKGFDLIWLMGVWQRSHDSVKKARNHPDVVKKCRAILKDFKTQDIAGSPYAIPRYVPDSTFGSNHDLFALKDKLEEMGLLLILDFVPNHTACDHDWVKQGTGYYIETRPLKDEECPKGFFLAKKGRERLCIAHGKDPYYAPWTDTAQINCGNPAATRAMAEILSDVSHYCHGFRCDMAMLVVKDVFKKTWGYYIKDDSDAKEFWRVAMDVLGPDKGGCLLLAEAYWGMERDLIDLGFDYTYDKMFYDLLEKEEIQGLKAHLSEPVDFQEKMVRFLENHDEPRAMDVFGNEKIYGAMVILATVPGMRLWHHGQFEGCCYQVPVQLKRKPVEPVNQELKNFSERLLVEVNHSVFHDGIWRLCKTHGWPDNPSHRNLLAWTWDHGEERRLIVVNYSDAPAQGLVMMPVNWLPGSERVRCIDPIKGDKYVLSTGQMEAKGLHVELRERDFHFFNVIKEQ